MIKTCAVADSTYVSLFFGCESEYPSTDRISIESSVQLTVQYYMVLNNPNIPVDTTIVMTHGMIYCTIYRFSNVGNYIYPEPFCVRIHFL